ncbi:MATE family efflux transporter [Candidatus Poribacteria bacterium]|nr:MATE family efflux transporter [Candidatus Poribacteria bacterium]
MRKPSSMNLTEGSIISSIWRLSLPIMIGNILQNLFSIVDMIFVGKLGPSAVAAVGMSGVILGMLYVVIFGIYTGNIALVSRFFGANQKEEAEHVAVQSLYLGVFFYAIVALIGYPSAKPLLELLGASDAVVDHGVSYIRAMFLGSFTMILSIIMASMFRAAGDARTPLIALVISTLINIGLDPLLIFGIWVFPDLGVAGSAWATVIARGLGVLLYLYFFFTKETIIDLRFDGEKPNLSTMGRIMKIGVFSSLQGILRNLSGLVLTRVVAIYGTFAIAAYVVVMRLQFVVLMVGFGLGTAVSTLVGQNLGADKPDRAARTAWIITGIGAAIMVFMGIVYIIFARSIIPIFNDHPEVLRIGTVYLRIAAVAFGFIALAIILGRALNGAGDTLSPMIMTAIGLLAFRIGLSLLLAQRYELMGIWLGIAISSIIQGLMTAGWFSIGRWKHKKV